MSDNEIIESDKLIAIIRESYKLIDEREITGVTKNTVIEKIIEFMKKELKEDAIKKY